MSIARLRTWAENYMYMYVHVHVQYMYRHMLVGTIVHNYMCIQETQFYREISRIVTPPGNDYLLSLAAPESDRRC